MSGNTLRYLILAAALTLAGATAHANDNMPVKEYFGEVPTGAPLQPESVGFYSKGCLAGGEALPLDGPAWQAMRLSRNRYWGTPILVDYIERFAMDVRAKDGWPGLLVGDMSQPRGGPMLTGHASHQTGLDVDIWFDPMPNRTLTREEREKTGARSYIKPGTNTELDKTMWTDAHSRMIRRAASYPEVQRVFVNAGVKKELCSWEKGDRSWLSKIRPWYLHDDHLHVRLKCPAGMPGCRAQDPPPPGDGCGENLAYWLSSAPYKPAKPSKGPFRYKPEMTILDLPQACRTVLAAGQDGIRLQPGPWAPVPPRRPATN